MKVGVFKKLTEENPWMLNYFMVKSGVGGSILEHGNLRAMFHDWVRRSVNYIAFRPWSSLDLTSTDSLEFDLLDEKSGHGVLKIVNYELLWNSGFDLKRPANGRFSKYSFSIHTEKKVSSVQALVRSTIVNQLDYPPGVPAGVREIHLDAVVRHTYRQSTLMDEKTGEKFEIFLIPRMWAPEWLENDQGVKCLLREKEVHMPGLHAPRERRVELTEYEKENRRRYFNHEPLLPIIPGVDLSVQPRFS